LILLVLVSLCLIAFFTLLTALLPNITRHSKNALQRSPWRSFPSPCRTSSPDSRR
jgi:hypothetical protein